MSETRLIQQLTGQKWLGQSKRSGFVRTSLGFAVVLTVYTAMMLALLPGIRIGMAFCGGAALSFALIARWAESSASLKGPAFAFVATGLGCTFAGAFVNGGADSYIAPFFVTTPIVCAYFLGVRGAFYSGLAAVACAALLLAADLAGYTVDSPYDPALLKVGGAIVLVSAIALTMIAAASFSRRDAEYGLTLERSNALLSAFVHAAPAAVAMFDRDLRYLVASERWLSDYGLTREEIIGRPHYDVFPEIPKRWKDIHARCLAGATERSQADRFVRADGTVQWLLWEVQPWRDMSGEIAGIIMVTRDISDQIRIQENLERATRQAEEASEAKSAFLATMSHEIRTPLNAVIGLTEALLDTPLDQRQKKLLTEAHRSGQHLLALISDVLDLSKLEAGKMEIDPVVFSLRGMVASVAGMFSSAAEHKRLRLEATIAPDSCDEIVADENRLRQVLVNLVGNALKFTSAGKISISASARKSAGGDVDLILAVADTGAGIAQDRIPHLFDAFTQADASTARNFGGTGLGLSISRKLVGEMGGRITCESALGEGSIFRVTLPVRAAVSEDRTAGAASAKTCSEALDGVRVLFVDDNAGNRLVYEEMAKKLGCAFAAAEDGAAAIAACSREKFDAIVMDIEMPDMDGVAAAAAIRDHDGPSSGAPVIAVTAHALKGDRERFLAAGMNGYLAKPVSRSALADAILQALGCAGEPARPIAHKAETALIDHGVIAELAGSLGPERAAALFGDIWGHLAGIIQRLEEAGAEEDSAILSKLAHDACGLAANLGAAALSHTLKDIELAARGGGASGDKIKSLGAIADKSHRALHVAIADLTAA